jgi:hypothetical protein
MKLSGEMAVAVTNSELLATSACGTTIYPPP